MRISRSLPTRERACDTPPHRADSGTAVNSLRRHTRNIRSPAPKEARAVSAEDALPSPSGARLLACPFREFSGPIRDDQIGAGAFERSHDLKNSGPFLEASFLRAGFHHRELTADVINRRRFAELLADAPQNIEIRQRGLPT